MRFCACRYRMPPQFFGRANEMAYPAFTRNEPLASSDWRTAIMPGCIDNLASAHYYRVWARARYHGHRGSDCTDFRRPLAALSGSKRAQNATACAKSRTNEGAKPLTTLEVASTPRLQLQ